MLPSETSGPVLAKLTPLLPGEVLPFVLEDVRPYGNTDWSANRLYAIIPELQAHELRLVQQGVRELRDGLGQCTAIAGLTDYVPDPARSEFLRTSLDAIPHIRLHWDQAMALAALAPKLPESLGSVALDIAEAIGDEPGARAVAEVAQAVPPHLRSRTIAALPAGYERWKAYGYAALAKKAHGPLRTQLFRDALAVIGRTDWDDTEALDAGFIKTHAADLPEALLETALDEARRAHAYDGLSSSVLAALAHRFDGPEGAAVRQEALAAAEHINNDAARVRVLAEIGVKVPGVAEAIGRIADPRWHLAGLAELGEPVPGEAIRVDDLADLDGVSATLHLLPFLPPERVRTVLTELRRSERWSALAEGAWLTYRLTEIVPRLGSEVLPDLLEIANGIPLRERAPLLAAIAGTFQLLPPPHLAECWRQTRAALDTTGRAGALETLATLALIVYAVGGPTAATDTAAAMHLVARWHP
jgi:hypothetical protein